MIVDLIGCGKDVVNRSTFQGVSTGDVVKPMAILEAAFAATLGNVQRNGLGRAEPLASGVTIKTVELFGDRERLSDVIDR